MAPGKEIGERKPLLPKDSHEDLGSSSNSKPIVDVERSVALGKRSTTSDSLVHQAPDSSLNGDNAGIGVQSESHSVSHNTESTNASPNAGEDDWMWINHDKVPKLKSSKNVNHPGLHALNIREERNSLALLEEKKSQPFKSRLYSFFFDNGETAILRKAEYDGKLNALEQKQHEKSDTLRQDITKKVEEDDPEREARMEEIKKEKDYYEKTLKVMTQKFATDMSEKDDKDLENFEKRRDWFEKRSKELGGEYEKLKTGKKEEIEALFTERNQINTKTFENALASLKDEYSVEVKDSDLVSELVSAVGKVTPKITFKSSSRK